MATEEPAAVQAAVASAAHGGGNGGGANGAGPSVDEATAAYEEAKRDAQAMKKTAQTALADQQSAEGEKKRLNAAKNAAEPGEAKGAATEVWKVACAAFTEAMAKCRAAKAAAKDSENARAAAWNVLKAARAEAQDLPMAQFLEGRGELISAPTQAYEGLKPWSQSVKVTNIWLTRGDLPKLDGSGVVMESMIDQETGESIDGETVPLEPIFGGSTVLAPGTGGGKTRRVIEWLGRETHVKLAAFAKYNKDLPFVFVSARINIAQKLEADLKKQGHRVRQR